ncbi:MAG: hypothetical protein AMJ88_15990 [Anaerolineae bacterium SM23_ 63]|nr:MAG: hypothetical protein AMJ88_15990 [Anaerolineae bacterium SM23_ 63]
MPPSKDTSPILQEGVGVEDIAIGRSSKADVIKSFGDNYYATHLKEYSVEMAYDELGLSFYYLQDDPRELVFSVLAKHPFTGRTSKGIGIGSIMYDVVAIYGKPNYWDAALEGKYTITYNGVHFRIERDTSLPRYPVDEGVHLPRKIIEISIREPW